MKSLEELVAIREKALKEKNGGDDLYEYTITIGMATCGITAGARPVFTTLLELLREHQISNCKVQQTGCFGHCKMEPMMTVEYKNHDTITYKSLTPEAVKEIIESHIIKGVPVKTFIFES